ncbi:MAG: LamG domain-containing protein [Myxococcales bacterium]|nr:LamG domain-containing protein [Myxococcales bacterium]MCB9705480.1 LamG domain-containing protein [Myxococcales bacterium]
MSGWARAGWLVSVGAASACTMINPAFQDDTSASASASASGSSGGETLEPSTSEGGGTTSGGASASGATATATATATTTTSSTSGDATITGSSAATTSGVDTGGDTSTTGGLADLIACADDPALVGCYHFPGDVADALIDGSIYANDGTLALAPIIDGAPGLGYAAATDASSVLKVVDDPMSYGPLDLKGSITMMAAVYLAELPPAGRVGVLDKEAQYSLFIGPDGDVLCKVGAFNLPSGVQVPLATWTHVACTFDGALVTIYLNGSLHAQIPHPDVLQSLEQGDLVLAGDSPGPADPLLGAIDNVEIWGVALEEPAICTRAGPLCG